MDNAKDGGEKKELPQLIVFDLDDTLSESKMPLEDDMAALLRQLLKRTKIAVISGAHLKRFEEQFLPRLEAAEEELRNLILAPTCGGALLTYESQWVHKYRHALSQEEKDHIFRVFKEHAFGKVYHPPEEPFGDIMEDRDSMVAFAGLGQKAPIEHKSIWDPDQQKRLRIREAVVPHLPDHEVRIGGATSIDVTRKGVDKGYGIEMLSEHIEIHKDDMLFIGDALFEGGNDYPVVATGVRVVPVKNPEHTKEVIKDLLEKASTANGESEI